MQTICKINGDRIFSRILRLGEIGKNNQNGVHRLALSKEDKEAHFLVSQWMEEAGLSVSHDHFGNLIGRKEGENPGLPAVMIGSHIDSVRNGGRFDGIIGVIAGIEVVQAITSAQIVHQHPLEVVAFCEEEGSRFNDGLFGSRGMVGKINERDLLKKDENGISRYEALKSFGFGVDPDRIKESIRTDKDIKLFLEMHIEQGPILETNGHAIGIVEGIAGPSWYSIFLSGEAGHAGTVPMNLRHDPLMGAAEVISEIERLCKQEPEKKTVGTVGIIQAFPGGSNVIPSSVEFSLDLRDIDLQRRSNVYGKIVNKVQNVCEKRGLTYRIEKHLDVDPIACSENIVSSLREISKDKGITAPIMISGAGHDAMLMSEITDIGMIFVRCEKGISHQPNEKAEQKDITLGTELLLEAVLKFV
ncbi:Zn-dependent hydrolase [Cytobacillus depressus]|uniref:Zn-dependent hydrolase n=1 Tax=Cytobacillus depressus TaxID=1602942 RepID=A0A6L3VE72_9BACI|nr:Zn-dependent hydrolase [Cytobacillus depressus]KAB2338014.1 Zn-dependent hydrolase [Cytobacillus depressus]